MITFRSARENLKQARDVNRCHTEKEIEKGQKARWPASAVRWHR